MTRTDVMASSRPHTAGAAPMRRGSSGIARRLRIFPAVLLLVLALAGPSVALAAGEPTSNYNEKAPTPATGTAPSKESKTPTTKTPEPTPTTSTEPAAETKASTLPFTGFDLRWSLAIGVLLIGAGFSIVAVQRRQSRGDRS
jgi:hypothetical protein